MNCKRQINEFPKIVVREETQKEEIISFLKCVKNIKYQLRIHSFQIPFQMLFAFLHLARKLYSKENFNFKSVGWFWLVWVFFLSFWIGEEGWIVCLRTMKQLNWKQQHPGTKTIPIQLFYLLFIFISHKLEKPPVHTNCRLISAKTTGKNLHSVWKAKGTRCSAV